MNSCICLEMDFEFSRVGLAMAMHEAWAGLFDIRCL